MSGFDSPGEDVAGDWLAAIDPTAPSDIRGLLPGISTEDFEPAPAPSVPRPASVPAAEQTPQSVSESVPESGCPFWPASLKDRAADSIRKQPLKSAMNLIGVTAVVAVITGVVVGYAMSEADSTPNQQPTLPSESVNPVDALLKNSNLMEGFVCPAQLDAEAGLMTNTNASRAAFYRQAANLMVNSIAPTKLAKECPPGAPTAISFNTPASLPIRTTVGPMIVYLKDVLPDLQS